MLMPTPGLGVSLKESKRKDEAEACFQQVVRLRPGCVLSLGNLAGMPGFEPMGSRLVRGRHMSTVAGPFNNARVTFFLMQALQSQDAVFPSELQLRLVRVAVPPVHCLFAQRC